MRARTSFLLLFVGLVAAAVLLREPLLSFARPIRGADEASPQGTTYYCPMHPSYRSDHPGDCPVCNMKLVPLEGAGSGGAQAQPTQGAWTCEMHTEIVGKEGDRCSECGMDLTPPSKSAPMQGMHDGEPRHEADSVPAGAQGASKAPVYYCPMHPSYRSDHPGDCPICNMKLVPLEEDAGGAMSVAGRGIVTVQPEQRQLIGVRTSVVERAPAQKEIRAAGRVEADETRLAAVNLKVGGWIEELFVRSVGERVEVGAPLFSLWSPELYEAQQSYALLNKSKLARGGSSEADAAMRAARERLLLWDLTEEQIRHLESGKEPERRTTIHARVAGTVTMRGVVAGTYVEPGDDLFQLADLSRLWIQVDVFEHELAQVHPGVRADLEVFALSGERFQGEVAFVYPTLDEARRTQRVRLEIDNADGRLKPGMYGAVRIPVDLGEVLTVADSAVLDSGERQLVFVEREAGRFEPREVELGARGEGWVVVQSGLEPGEKVVTSGTFLIDSESRLRAAVLGSSSGGSDSEGGAHEHHH